MGVEIIVKASSLLGKPCTIIAEVAQSHDGSLGLAHAFIDAIADAGADAVKFQTHIAAAESTPGEPWRVKFSLQDESRYEYWRRMEFTEPQWAGLKSHAEDRDLLFLSSPFSLEAAELLERLGVQAWKVASGELTNPMLLSKLVSSGLPMLVSTGMSSIEEIDGIAKRLRADSSPFAILQCTSMYPVPPDRVGLNMIPFFRERYGCAVGLSDHSGTIYPSLAAATLGVDVLEIHVTLSREMFGPDVPASVTTEELRQIVEGVRYIEQMMTHSVDKDDVAESMADMRRLFTKSVAARVALSSGDVLAEGHLTVKKPGTGIPAAELPNLVGRRLANDVEAGALLKESDLE